MNKAILIKSLICFAILLQNCVVYQRPATLSEVVNMGKVKLVDSDGVTYKYKNIELNEHVYYGVGAVYSNRAYIDTSEGFKTPIDSLTIESVYLKDKKKSNVRTVLLVLGVIPVAYLTTGLLFFLIIGI